METIMEKSKTISSQKVMTFFLKKDSAVTSLLMLYYIKYHQSPLIELKKEFPFVPYLVDNIYALSWFPSQGPISKILWHILALLIDVVNYSSVNPTTSQFDFIPRDPMLLIRLHLKNYERAISTSNPSVVEFQTPFVTSKRNDMYT